MQEEYKYGICKLKQWCKNANIGIWCFSDCGRGTRCVLDAISDGYRGIDTAQGYFNEGVGDAISKCSLPREELFLTTKIWISNGGYEKAKESIEESLRKLKTDYIDLMLIHQPFNESYYGSYRAMEEAYKEGKIRAIGVLILCRIDLLISQDSWKFHQQSISLKSMYFNNRRLAKDILKNYGTQLMAWSPLA